MGWKIIFSLLFILVAISLLVFYWFLPFGTNVFVAAPSGNSNFTLVSNSSLQFYPNMRYPDSRISYFIEDSCTLQKKDDMKRAFLIMSEKTLLNFYENWDAEIYVACDDKNKVEGKLFIAGEGGPVNITVSGKYNVIFNGKILLIKDSECETPNIALHELLHTLGFEHSVNQNNLMYPVTSCNQAIGEDVIQLINELYSVPSLPDLVLGDASAIMHGNYLDLIISARNEGLEDSGKSEIAIYVDGAEIKTFEMAPVKIGHGMEINMTNIWVKNRNAEQITLVVDSGFDELDFANNQIILQVQNN